MYRSPETTPVKDWDIVPSIDINVGQAFKNLYEDKDSYPVIDVERAPFEDLLASVVKKVEGAGYDTTEVFDKKLRFEVGLSTKGDLEQKVTLYFKSSERCIDEMAPLKVGEDAIFLTILPKRWEVVPSINVKAGQKFAKKYPEKILNIDRDAAVRALEILSPEDTIPAPTYIELGGKLPISSAGHTVRLSAYEQLIKLKIRDSVEDMNKTASHELQHVADLCSPKEDHLNNMASYPNIAKGRRLMIRSFFETFGGTALTFAGHESAAVTAAGISLILVGLYEGSKVAEIGESYQEHRAEVRARKAEENVSSFSPIITISLMEGQSIEKGSN